MTAQQAAANRTCSCGENRARDFSHVPVSNAAADELAHTLQQDRSVLRRQAETGVADVLDELEEAPPTVQRSTKWNGATVHENHNKAKDKATKFKGTSADKATEALWTAMGNTPKDAAKAFRTLRGAKVVAYHATAAGGKMVISNEKANADCSTSSIDVTNPS